jgi:hypothetical protein
MSAAILRAIFMFRCLSERYDVFRLSKLSEEIGESKPQYFDVQNYFHDLQVSINVIIIIGRSILRLVDSSTQSYPIQC